MHIEKVYGYSFDKQTHTHIHTHVDTHPKKKKGYTIQGKKLEEFENEEPDQNSLLIIFSYFSFYSYAFIFQPFSTALSKDKRN